MRVAAYDPAGQLLALCTPEAAERALARREAVRTQHGIQLRASQAVGIREMSPEEKRRRELAKHRR